ncbi:hypothetical protein PTTG_02483, partial [Puccinia triticina 1-1 BBBD Race 1]
MYQKSHDLNILVLFFNSQVDQCTKSHKAADEKRNESTWMGCDDTKLMGCCCQHDAAMSFANIYKSGEQRHFPMSFVKHVLENVKSGWKVGSLYDIACKMDKYIDHVFFFPSTFPSFHCKNNYL